MLKKIRKFFKKLSREQIIFTFFILWGLIIMFKVFSYTILNYEFYKKLADKQQIWKVDIPVTRWNIYSKSNTTFATSVNLNDLAIDPTMKWDKAKLIIYLKNLVYEELCKNKSDKFCYEWILKFTKKLEIPDFKYDEKYIKNLIIERLKEKINNLKVTSVLLEQNLSEQTIQKLKNLWLKWVYANNWKLYVNPEEINLPELVSKKLAQYINIPQPRIKYLIRKRVKRYIPIINKLSIDWYEKLKSYLNTEKEAIKRWILDEEKSIVNYIILTPYPQRYYPERTLASQIIGFVDNSWIWHYWLEWFFNKILKWNDWYIIAKKDIKWRTIDPISLNMWDIYWEWAKIYTTVDRNVQKKVEKILERWVKRFRANKWTIVILNPKTWEVIAMANYPSFDLNNPWNVYELEKVNYWKYPNPIEDLKWVPIFVIDNKQWNEYFYDWKKIKLREATIDEIWNPAIVKYKYKNNFWPNVYQNDAITALYEPGSIMKPFTVSIWLDSWEITKYSKYEDKWKVTIDDFTISNVSRKCIWYHTFWHALNYSCNVWMLKIAKRYWKAIAYEYLNKFWFGRPTWISLQWEIYKDIDNYEKWSRARLFTSSYWLWINATAIQMAVWYSALVNGWLYIKPHIVDKIVFWDWRVLKYKTEIDHRVIKESTSKEIVKMLVDSINNWVAKLWNVEGYTLWGKTGTAQIASKWWYEKWAWATYASFAWFWPAEDPKFVIIVKLVRPRTSQYWGLTSSHIFKDVATYLLKYYWIPKKKVTTD